jgi:hypothetical protein
MEVNARLCAVLAVGLWGSGCIEVPGTQHEDERLDDGSVCETNDDCKSRLCGIVTKMCSHSTCDCPGDACDAQGEASSDCAHGWVCVYYESIFEDIGQVFNVEHDMNGGYCQPLCEAGCPEHYTCAGRFCKPDDHWTYPVPKVTWSGAATGELTGRDQMIDVDVQHDQSVQLSASATSPIDAEIKMVQWMLISNVDRTEVMGNDAELSVDAGSFTRAELTVIDADGRAGLMYVSFNACSGPGDACGYQGSGCCNGCDSTGTTCL